MRETVNREKYVEYRRKERADKKWKYRRREFISNSFYVVSIGGGASIPFLLNILVVSKVVITIISAIVAIATAMLNHFKFAEKAQIAREAYEGLHREIMWYEGKIGAYGNLSEKQALDHFAEQTQLILRKHIVLIAEVQKTNKTQKGDGS